MIAGSFDLVRLVDQQEIQFIFLYLAPHKSVEI